MPIAVKPKRRRVTLHEEASAAAPLKVERDKGVIHHVKILGLDSKNGRRYTLEALRRAVPLYEGIRVNIDHLEKNGDRRSSRDRFGKLVSVTLEADGLYGDLHYLTEHSMAGVITEAAERMPDAFGLSHDAEGKGYEDEDGVFVVEEIVEAKFVDVVADAATTTSLSEGVISKQTTLAAVIKTARPAVQKRFARLLEDDAMGAMPMDAPAAAPDEMSYEEHLGNMVAAIMQDAGLDAAAKRKKILAALKLLDEPEAAATEEDDTDADDLAKDDDEKKVKERYPAGKNKKGQMAAIGANRDDPHGDYLDDYRGRRNPALAQLQEQVAKLTKERDAERLRVWIGEECNQRRLAVDAHLLEHCLRIGDKKEIREHLDYLRDLRGSHRTRSAPPGGGTAPREMGVKEFVASLRN